jgi:hypothetical protein
MLYINTPYLFHTEILLVMQLLFTDKMVPVHVTSSTGDSNNNHDYEYNYCNTPYGASNSPTDKTVIFRI